MSIVIVYNSYTVQDNMLIKIDGVGIFLHNRNYLAINIRPEIK